MKVSLVVAQGIHQGKVIPITGSEFVIGRDPGCQLRPASQAISKKHCAVVISDGKVFIRDFKSTNGTYVNEEPVDGEREINDTDRLKIGPLEFTLKLERVVARATPAPGGSKVGDSKVGNSKVGDSKVGDSKAKTIPATKPGSSAGSSSKNPVNRPTPAPTAVKTPEPEAVNVDEVEPSGPTSDDRIAAMLLDVSDEPSANRTGDPEIPEGSTAMDLPVLGKEKTAETKKSTPTQAKDMNSSSAAADLLRRYMNRPRPQA